MKACALSLPSVRAMPDEATLDAAGTTRTVSRPIVFRCSQVAVFLIAGGFVR